MNTSIHKTHENIEKLLAQNPPDLYRAYEQTVRLRSQLLGIIHDRESFGSNALAQAGAPLASRLTRGTVASGSARLVVHEPLPPLKELTAAVEDHWLNLMQCAIGKAAAAGSLPRLQKAFVWIELVTPKGSDNAKLWDTSNRAVNLIINNLKGVFFEDDDHEHMAFGVAGRWGEKGVTIIHVMPFDRLGHITAGSP